MAITKVPVPATYLPKFYVFQRKDRDGWSWKYTLPLTEDVWFYRNVAGDERRSKKNAKLKEKDLLLGMLDDKELKKYQSHGRSGVTTIEKACELYQAETALEKSKVTRHNESYAVPFVFRFFQEEMEHRKLKFVNEISFHDILAYRTFLSSQVEKGEIKKVTAKGYLNTLRRIFSWLRDTKRIATNPCLEIKPIIVPKAEKARTVAITAEQAHMVVRSPYKNKKGFDIKQFFLFLFQNGPRLAEALHAEWDDFDLGLGIWRIKNKPNCPTKLGMGWEPKQGKEREVVLSTATIALLKQIPRVDSVGYVPKQPTKKNGKTEWVAVPAKFIFVNPDNKRSTPGNPAWKRVDDVRGAWAGLFKSVGLWSDEMKLGSDFRITRHDTRRGWNVEATDSDMEASARSHQLGHSEEVNRSHYGGKAKETEMQRKIRAALDRHPSNDLSLVAAACSTGVPKPVLERCEKIKSGMSEEFAEKDSASTSQKVEAPTDV